MFAIKLASRVLLGVGILYLLWHLFSRVKSSPNVPRLSLKKPEYVLITGAAGFIGHHVVMRLKRDNIKVIGIDNFNNYYDVTLKNKRAAVSGLVKTVDVCDTVEMQEIIESLNVSHVIHLAAQAGVRYSLEHPQAYVKSNIECFVHLLEILKNRNIPLIYASSSSVYGKNIKTPFSELDRVDLPASLYAATKRENELLAHVYWNVYKLRSIGLRFFTVYGPWGRPDMACFAFVKNITQDYPISVFNYGKMSRDFTYIDDIVDGIVRSLYITFNYEIVNLGRGQPQELMIFIKAIEKALNKKPVLNFKEMAKGDVLKTYADISKATSLLGYHPYTSIEEGVEKFVEWYNSYTTK